jgi:peptidyl-prolyl cis-trans isomerase D
MAVIAITFIVGMGWWGYGGFSTDTVATVGPLKVSRDEYVRRYKTLSEFAKKQNLPDAIKDEVLRQMAVEQMAEEKLWRLVADEMGLTLSPDELHAAVTQLPEFQTNGKFDPDRYTRLLAFNHLTPAQFESEYTSRLLGDKAMTVVFDSVALTPAEIEEANALVTRSAPSEGAQSPSARDRILHDLLLQKQQRAVIAFREMMRTKIPVQIKKELL